MPIEIPYLILLERPLKTFSIFAVGLAANLPEDGLVEHLINDAALTIPSHLDVYESRQVVTRVTRSMLVVYTLVDPISAFIGRPRAFVAKELGVIDQTFLYSRAVRWPPMALLSELGIKKEGNVGQALVIYSPDRSPKYVREDVPKYIPFSREEVRNAALKRDTPSIGSYDFKLLAIQTENSPDAMYNGRPYELTAPPIEIYHPVFATFRRKMAQPTKDFTFSATELEQVHTLITKSLAFYDGESARKTQLYDVLYQLVHDQVLYSDAIYNGQERKFFPDGVSYVICRGVLYEPNAAILFTELNNGFGEGGPDPIAQSQCDYIAFYSSAVEKSLRDACCCPAFLIGISGPYMIISGAVFTDHFMSQNLTDYLYLGGNPYIGPRLRDIAKVLRVLKECLTDLEEYYEELAPIVPPPSRSESQRRLPKTIYFPERHPSSEMSISVLFPHFKKFIHATSGQHVELEYIERVQPFYPAKAIFKALARSSGSDVTTTVFVKFTPTYCQKAHELLQKHLRAPQLWFCEIVETVGMYVVVMDFIAGHRIGERGPSRNEADGLREAVRILHDNDLVYGDLRSPNIILPTDGNSIMLVDFDWSGKAGEASYPPDINMDPSLGWHPDVCRGGLILPDHDVFMLDQLVRGRR